MVITHMVNVSQLQLLEYLPATSVSKTSSENATIEQTTCGIGSRVSDSMANTSEDGHFRFRGIHVLHESAIQGNQVRRPWRG